MAQVSVASSVLFIHKFLYRVLVKFRGLARYSNREELIPMTDEDVRGEIAKQIHDTLALLATKLRAQAQNHGPVIAKALNLTADEIETLPS
jgi:hypothetical protein